MVDGHPGRLKMELNLKEKTVLVTGSSKGIGKKIAELFLEQGCNVVFNGRHEAILKQITKNNPNTSYCVADVTKISNCKKLVSHTKKKWGKLDILICNVGNGKSVPPGNEKTSDWERIFGLNFFATTNMIEESKTLLSKSSGSIVCISSITGVENTGASIPYSVAKSALNFYVKCASKPLAKQNIRINAVAPGNIYFKGSVWEKKLKNNPSKVRKMLKNHVSLNQFGRPEDIANTVLFLTSQKSSFVTGSIFVIDGGQVH